MKKKLFQFIGTTVVYAEDIEKAKVIVENINNLTHNASIIDPSSHTDITSEEEVPQAWKDFCPITEVERAEPIYSLFAIEELLGGIEHQGEGIDSKDWQKLCDLTTEKIALEKKLLDLKSQIGKIRNGCMKSKMFGSKVDYIVQIRVQDYWLDYEHSTFIHKGDAVHRLNQLKINQPDRDFQLVKRTTSFEDLVLD